MRKLSIAHRLYAIIALGAVGLAVGSAFLVVRTTRLSHALQAIDAKFYQHDQARVMQVTFKKQV